MDLKRISAELTRRRKELGITQAELAALSNCGTTFIRSVEHGKPSIRLDKLLEVLDALGLELCVEEQDRGTRQRTRA